MSSAVTALMASRRAASSFCGVRGCLPRTNALTFSQQFSIGEKSGEYAGSQSTSALTAATATSTWLA